VLTAIAHAQGRISELERAYAWFDQRRAMFPNSPFGRLMHGAVDARAAARGLRAPFSADASLLDGFDEAPGLPSWLASIEEIVGACWIAADRLDLAARAIEKLRGWRAVTSPLGLASVDLLDARLRLALDERPAAIALARNALDRSTRITAPWWLVRSARLLADLGSASGEEVTGAERLAARLSLAGSDVATSGTG
jgi:hypothetical protein